MLLVLGVGPSRLGVMSTSSPEPPNAPGAPGGPDTAQSASTDL